ncbi:MAG: YceI family protein [Acidobacteria bacterium]|nr:YceI family protein [Acidobacteriota bacterium]
MKAHIARRLLPLALVASLTWIAGADTSAESAPQAPTGVWRIDPARSDVQFTITKLGFEDVTGVFRQSEGEIRYDPARPSASSIQWRVRVASVVTDALNRDRSLQAEEYFDAGRHPYLSFVSRTVRSRDADSLQVDGDITIRGVTRALTIIARPRATPNTLTFETDIEINRYDFGVRGGSVMGRLIGSMARVRLVAVAVPAGRTGPQARVDSLR